MNAYGWWEEEKSDKKVYNFQISLANLMYQFQIFLDSIYPKGIKENIFK